MIRGFWRLICLMLLLLTTPVQADELRPGYLEFTQRDAVNWQLVWKAPVRGGLTPDTQPILPSGCKISGSAAKSVAPLAVITTYPVRCTAPVAGKALGLTVMDAAQTDILVRVAPLGRPVQALRLTAAQPSVIIAARPDRLQVARTYLVIGAEHILFGYDHLLFVVALVLLLGRFWAILKAATAFTLAHSITLIGTTLGFMGLPQAPVEAIIALSIIFLAVEIIKQQPDNPRLSERLPWVVAFLFGLLHGFGFAGALKEIGLPESDVPTALLTFNLGVEAGQLLIVAAALLIIRAAHRLSPPLVRPMTMGITYAIGTIASFWLFERLLPG